MSTEMLTVPCIIYPDVPEFSDARGAASWLKEKGWRCLGVPGSSGARYLPAHKPWPHGAYDRVPVFTRWPAGPDEPGPGRIMPVVVADDKGVPQVCYQTTFQPPGEPMPIDMAVAVQIETEVAALTRRPMPGEPTEEEKAEALSSQRVSEARDRWFSLRASATGLTRAR